MKITTLEDKILSVLANGKALPPGRIAKKIPGWEGAKVFLELCRMDAQSRHRPGHARGLSAGGIHDRESSGESILSESSLYRVYWRLHQKGRKGLTS